MGSPRYEDNSRALAGEGRRVGSVAKGKAKMDRPEVVVRVQKHNNDDLVRYLLPLKQEEGLGAGFIQGVASTVVIKDHSLPNQGVVARSIIKLRTTQELNFHDSCIAMS